MLTVKELIQLLPSELLIKSINEIDLGNTHSIYFCEGELQNYVLKVRHTSLKKFQNVICKPEDISKEFEAMKLYSSAASNINYNICPTPIFIDADNGILLMTDLNWKQSYNLEEYLIENEIDEKLLKSLNVLMKKHLSIVNTINSDMQTEAFEGVLNLRFSKYHLPFYNSLIERNLKAVRKFMHGAFSDKNIIINSDKSECYICDFETTCIGNAEFDVAFYLITLLLKRNINDEYKHTLFNLINELESKYKLDKQLLLDNIAGLLLYRLNSIPKYTLSLSKPKEDVINFLLNEYPEKPSFDNLWFAL